MSRSMLIFIWGSVALLVLLLAGLAGWILTLPSATAAAEPPPRFGKYRFVRRLGEGSTSEVFLCHDDFHDRSVAVKRVRAQALADTVPAMLRAQERILEPLTKRQRSEFMRLLQLLVTQNNDLSRAPGEAR